MNGRIKRLAAIAAKRLFDVVASILLLILLAPAMLALALLVAVTMGRPVLFHQSRPGLSGRLFTLHKFRTMRDARGPDGAMLPDTQRLTKVGRLLRASSLDELPELLNVLRGDMSLVGPRPLLPEYLDKYTPEQAKRHRVKPGLTGFAQISGRQSIPFSKRLELDVYYTEHWSLWFDLKIFLLTVPKVLGIRGVVLDYTLDDIDDLGLNPASSLGSQRKKGSHTGQGGPPEPPHVSAEALSPTSDAYERRRD